MAATSPSVVFVGAKRTPFGSIGGAFRQTSATDLGVHAARAALEQSKIPASAIDHVIFGNVIQSSSDAAYLARHIGLKSGVPQATPAVTVNRLCGSGFESIVNGADLIRLGKAKAILAGGAENMSLCPYVIRNARFGQKLGNQELEDSLMSGLFDTVAQLPMALTAEKLAGQYKITREECDRFALRSQKEAHRATVDKTLSEEIAPHSLLTDDAHIRPDASYESMAKLKSVFQKDGVVTAGNASGMVDGAASVVLTSGEFAASNGSPILGEYLGSAVVGCDPTIMGIGPVHACRELLKQLGMKLADFAVIEINEAFAGQVLAVTQALEIPADRINQDGGAIAIGHPLGASGTRLTAHLLYALRKRGGGLGLASACIGGGQGIAVAVKV